MNKNLCWLVTCKQFLRRCRAMSLLKAVLLFLLCVKCQTALSNTVFEYNGITYSSISGTEVEVYFKSNTLTYSVFDL